MKVLVACEESQAICLAFRNKGHEAFSCDIQNCTGGHPEWHIKDDVLNHLIGWDLIIGHPPCTYLSAITAPLLFKEGSIFNLERYNKGIEAAKFFYKLWNADCKYICLENPRPLKCFNLPSYSQVIEPYYFGHEYSKRTCLWLKNLPPLFATCFCEVKESWVYSHNPGSRTSIIRSKTFAGIANAMANQWGNIYE